MAELMNLKDYIVTGKLEDAKAVVNDAIAAGADAQDIINNYLIKGMEEIGKRFDEGQAFVPNLLLAARAMKGCLEILKPLLADASSASLGTLVIGTVKGDLHDIGKNLVASMLEGCGFEVINLGVDISDQQFVEAVKKYNPQIVCLSALLTTTMNYMQNVIETLSAEGLRDQVKVLVGGAPVNEEFAMKIGADGYSSNANAAVILAKRVLQAC
ncbi:corrinoid protein [Bacteroides sp.]|uniref:corrinoid protein n=1 Tax=Bacteroides sp. TaxID=29523 RepID=UPI00261BD160|nr:corrinoid protein [Bacteroides sp.]